jgi:hypothetical protein
MFALEERFHHRGHREHREETRGEGKEATAKRKATGTAMGRDNAETLSSRRVAEKGAQPEIAVPL